MSWLFSILRQGAGSAVMLLILITTFSLYRTERAERIRQECNVAALTDTVRTYIGRDSSHCAAIFALEYTRGEMERNAADLRQKLRAMEVRLSDVTAAASVQLEANATLRGKLSRLEGNSFGFIHAGDPYLRQEGSFNLDSMTFRTHTVVPVRLAHAVVPRYKFRFWFLRIGLRGMEFHTSVDNPHVRITGQEYVIIRE